MMAKSISLAILLLPFVAVLRTTPASAQELRGVYVGLHNNREFGALPLVPDRDWRRFSGEFKRLGVNAVTPAGFKRRRRHYASRVSRCGRTRNGR